MPAGVTKVYGEFSRGDIVEIISQEGIRVGKGITAYNSEEIEKIKGCKSKTISSKLGHAGRSALVHRDDMVV